MQRPGSHSHVEPGAGKSTSDGPTRARPAGTRRRTYNPGVGGAVILGSGRDADIVDLGRGRVLRRPRMPRPLDDEAAIMRHVRAAGFPAPAVLEVRPDGIVMERVDGISMLADLARRPWRVGHHARLLAGLHRSLHRIPPPADARTPFGGARADDVTVHADLHPDNVLLSPRGPVVIDWANAGRGPAGADVADVWLVLAAARPPGGHLRRALAAALRTSFLDAFLAAAGRDDAAPYLQLAAERRALDHRMDEAELKAIRRIAAGPLDR